MKYQEIINKGSKILMLGLSFKENVGDIRNSKSAELAKIIMSERFKIECFDPRVDKNELLKEYNIRLKEPKGKYDCVIITVSHKEFIEMKVRDILGLIKKETYIVDVKGAWKEKLLSKHNNYWCL